MYKHHEDRLIDRHELRELVPYSLTHIRRLEHAGEFPQRVKIGANRVAWSLNEVLDWITAWKARRGHAPETALACEDQAGGAV